METGQLTLILGPMFSGKTTELHRLYRRKKIAGKKVLMVNSSLDTRAAAGGTISKTHEGDCIQTVSLSDLRGLDDRKEMAGVTDVFVDEGQFLEGLGHVQTLLEKGINVAIASLDSNYKREPFVEVLKLIPHALTVEKKTAVCCYCGSEAGIYSLRKSSASSSSSPVLIGGAETYSAACRACAKGR